MSVSTNSKYYNYNVLNDILNKKNFNETYNEKLSQLFDKYKKYVKTKRFTESIDKKIQRSRIIKNYIIPLSYLIYGYIYTKYYNLQIKKLIKNESESIYDMIGLLFSGKNPSTKILNVYYYKEFKKVKKENTNLQNTNLFNDISSEKNKTISFFEKIIELLNKENEEYNIYLNICKNFKELIIIIDDIKNILSNINTKFLGTLSDRKLSDSIISIITMDFNTILLSTLNTVSINPSLYNDRDNIFNIILNLLKDKTIYSQPNYREMYITLFNLYNDKYLPKINEINQNVILLKDNHNDLISYKYIIKDILIKFKSYLDKYNAKKIIFNRNKNIIKNINNIISIFKEDINDINYLFEHIKKTNKLSIDKYISIIKATYEEKINNINGILKNLNDTIPIDKSFQNIYESIEIETNNNFNLILFIYFIVIIINQNIENKYLFNYSKINDDTKYIIEPKYVNIEKIKNIFDIKYRIYKKNNIDHNTQYIIYLNNIVNELNNDLDKDSIKRNSAIKLDPNIQPSYEAEKIAANKAEIEYNNKNNISKYFNSIISVLEKIFDNADVDYDVIKSDIVNLINSKIAPPPPILTLANLQNVRNIKAIEKVFNDALDRRVAGSSIYVRDENNNRIIDDIDKLISKLFKIYNTKYSTTFDYNELQSKINEYKNFIDIKLQSNLNRYIDIEKITSLSSKLLIEKDKLQKDYQNKYNAYLVLHKTYINTQYNIDQKSINIKLKITLNNNYNDLITNITSIKNTTLSNNSIIQKKTLLDNEFKDIIDISKKYSEYINKIEFKNTDNKLFYIYINDIKKLDDIIKSIDKLTNFDTLIKDINNYFIINNSTILFDKLLSKANDSNKTVKIEPTLEEYINYNKNLVNKIKVLLQNINKKNIVLDTDDTKKETFQLYIIYKKIKKYTKIYDKSKNENNKINGTIKHIVSYTNVIYMYFISLLIIIDFLIYFYS